MKQSRHTEQQMVGALRQAEGARRCEVCRKLGITEQTFSRWKRTFAGMGVAELRQLRQVEEENRRLKQVVADLTLDTQMPREALRNNGCRRPSNAPSSSSSRLVSGSGRGGPVG